MISRPNTWFRERRCNFILFYSKTMLPFELVISILHELKVRFPAMFGSSSETSNLVLGLHFPANRITIFSVAAATAWKH